MIDRRHILSGAAASVLLTTASRAGWSPSRPGTIVVPYPAGGGTDVLARLLGRDLGAALSSSFVVENVPGASGSLGARRVARAEPDGLTLLVTTNQTHATNVSLMKDGGGYDPIADFTVLGGLADLQHLLVVRKDLGTASVRDLVQRAKGGALTCASTGPGSASHLTMELFKARTGVQLVHVPYRGAAPLLQDMIGGRVDLAFATVPTVLGQIQAGELKALAVASTASCPQVPDVPTLAKEGIEGVEADAWIAAFAPAKLPTEIVQRYAETMGGILAPPETRATIIGQGMLPNWRPPETFAAFQKQDIERWRSIIRAANVSAD